MPPPAGPWLVPCISQRYQLLSGPQVDSPSTGSAQGYGKFGTKGLGTQGPHPSEGSLTQGFSIPGKEGRTLQAVPWSSGRSPEHRLVVYHDSFR